jgi:hypothetical protein
MLLSITIMFFSGCYFDTFYLFDCYPKSYPISNANLFQRQADLSQQFTELSARGFFHLNRLMLYLFIHLNKKGSNPS